MVPYEGEWRSDYAHLVRLSHGFDCGQTLEPTAIGRALDSLCSEALSWRGVMAFDGQPQDLTLSIPCQR